MSFAKALKSTKKKTNPVWKGPEVDGITFSLLSRFLCCRERFRCLVVEGLKTADQFYAPLEYGNMWHVCEEWYAKTKVFNPDKLILYCRELCRKYPLQQEQVNHWHEMAKAQFPIYVHYWAKHPDVKDRTPLLQERPFNVPYELPSGRIVKLRGKWDSVDLIGKGKDAGIDIQENKTKSSIDQGKLTRQLGFDLQTMIYVIALKEYQIQPGQYKLGNEGIPRGASIKGVRYNVIRRSAHKSVDSMLKKLHEDLADNRGEEWFARWKVEISQADVERFKTRCLNPILEQLCDWWQTIADDGKCKVWGGSSNMHWQHPFGVYNVLDEGGSSDLDNYLETGSELGLQRTDNLFPELS